VLSNKSEQGAAVEPCKYSNQIPSSIKGGKCPNRLHDCKFVNNESAVGMQLTVGQLIKGKRERVAVLQNNDWRTKNTHVN
jgi:hypothetical protein